MSPCVACHFVYHKETFLRMQLRSGCLCPKVVTEIKQWEDTCRVAQRRTNQKPKMSVYCTYAIQVRSQVKIPSVECVFVYICPMQRSYESHLDRHGVLWNAIYPSCPSWPLPFRPHSPPQHTHTHITPAQPETSQLYNCTEVLWGVSGGEEGTCRCFLTLSPSVWDLQTHFEPCILFYFLVCFVWT